MKGLIVTIILLGLFGCAGREGRFSGKLGKEKMEAVLWDVIRADVFTEQFVKKDSMKNAQLENMKLQNKIFSLHNVSREDFYESYQYYLSHTDLMRVMLDSIAARAERERPKMMEQQMGGRQNAVDTNYTWKKTIHY